MCRRHFFMKDIDDKLKEWAIHKIETEYKDDVALLIGQKGACKIPTDPQNVAFDYFVPCTEKGYQLAETFVIEDMGYDLYPMSWERLEGIASLNEQMTFAFANAVILYARTEADRNRFLALQQLLACRLKDRAFTEKKTLEQVDAAMELYKTLLFDDNLSHIRKAAAGIMKYLSSAVATFNGTYLNGTFGEKQYIKQVTQLKEYPKDYEMLCLNVICTKNEKDCKVALYQLIHTVRRFLEERRGQKKEPQNYNYEDLAGWYYEMRYTFRRLAYYVSVRDVASAYELAGYMQPELDIVSREFALKPLDIMGIFDAEHLERLEKRSEEIEEYIILVLKEQGVSLKIYANLDEFLNAENQKNT